MSLPVTTRMDARKSRLRHFLDVDARISAESSTDRMTTLAVLADIHGNLPALEAVWNDLSRFEVDQVVIAGDSINWGPHSLEVLEFLSERQCAIVRGNHEYYLLDYDTSRAPALWSEITGERLTGPRWIHHQVGDSWRNRIASWPDTLVLRFADAPPVRVVHGTLGNHWQGIYPDTPDEQIANALATTDESTVITAHTHLALEQRVDRWHIINPGSVGNPADGILAASYMLLESNGDRWYASHRRVDFDRERVVQDLARQNLQAEHGDFGELVIEEFRTARQHVGPYMLWRRSHFPGEPMTTSLIDRFSDEDRWEHTFPAYHLNRNHVETL